MDSNGVSQIKFFEPLTNVFLRLFDQCPHRQAINETAWPLWILKLNTIPKPCQNDSGRFAKASRDVDELGMAIRARIAASKPSLVVERLMACGGVEERVVLKPAHDLPPSLEISAICLVMCRRVKRLNLHQIGRAHVGTPVTPI